MTRPAAFRSTYPPSFDTFRGAITMRLASGGADADELVEEFSALAEEFGEHFPDDAPVDVSEVPGIVDDVIVAYQKVVTELSADAIGLLTALDELLRAGILYSYGDAVEASDALEYLEDAYAAVAEEGGALRGWLYSTVSDLDELVLNQRLVIHFGTFDADSTAVDALARKAVDVLREQGLAADWTSGTEDPIVITPMVVDAPLVTDDECSCEDGQCGDDCACGGHEH